ncbi:MAG: HEAT repeat domain-containing protein [Ignavibacteriaceae bacterium]|nr:HEAT repeat domain-containing protein [Ignavibacteriaceae bacterium]
MKRFGSLSLLLVWVVILNICSIAQTPVEIKSSANLQNISESLLMGVHSDNPGVKAKCTYLLGEFCCSKAVIPLLSILHNCDCEELRILAALSLYKIGDARGIFAIKQAIKFDESDWVRRMCRNFYNAYLLEKYSKPVDVASN